MNGILFVDKPADWTSFDVVNKTRSVIRHETGKKLKVGHAGTLDPFATGLLVVLIGKATKKQQRLMGLNKKYQAEAVLGKKSTTGDPEGELVDCTIDKKPTDQEVEEIERKFIGKQMQQPHKFSAIKIDGKRAYQLAREGKEVKINSREIHIYDLEVVRYEYPHIMLFTEVSSGTYIRTLIEDIGNFLGTGAYTRSLRRTAVGDYDVKNALTEIDDVTYDIIKAHLIPLESIRGL